MVAAWKEAILEPEETFVPRMSMRERRMSLVTEAHEAVEDKLEKARKIALQLAMSDVHSLRHALFVAWKETPTTNMTTTTRTLT